MTAARSALDVFRAGPVAAAAALWRSRGQLHVTLVAKATFAMVPGGEVRRIEPLEVIRSEVYTRGNPMKPLLAASELAPWLPRAEVVLTGHAWATGGAPVRRMAVRLAILRAGAALVDKRLEVVGDRTGGAAPAGAQPEPFVKMPIEYQRAFGGPGEPENPLGVGAVIDERAGGGALPNLLPLGGGRAPVGLGPIPPIVPSRTRLLRGLARAELEGIASIPDDFDWSYFQSAPADQRFDRVLGGEEIVLEGLSQRHPTLATRLPALRALATILLPNGAARWLPLAGDTLIVQPDAERCAIVFRGSFQVASEEVLSALRVAVGVEVGDEPVPWPDLSEAPAGAASATDAAAGESAKRTDWSSTVRLGEGDVVDAPVSVAAARERPRDGAHPLEGTFPLDDTLPPAGSERRPREARTVPLPPPVRVRGPGQDDAVSAPFPIAPAGAHGERESGERPSAPWAAGRATAIPAIASPLEGTVDLTEPEATPAPAPAGPAQDTAPAPAPVEIAAPAPAQAAAPAPAQAAAPAPMHAAAPAPAPAQTAAPASTHAAAPAPAPTHAAAPAPVATPAPPRAPEPLPAPERDPQVERSPEPRAPTPSPSASKRERPNLLGSLYKRFRKD
ncbi:DUF2169 domain-containing protein [Sorangium sp. So ce375]|uniref:DUF2169 family type VI secretion system accessory protein n=1 Tax=Sorangium sp. So ce375 TaxID=3133306 RepID=UPI003F5C794B